MSRGKAPKQVPLVAHQPGGGSRWTDRSGVEREFLMCLCHWEVKGLSAVAWDKMNRHCYRQNLYVARYAQWLDRNERIEGEKAA